MKSRKLFTLLACSLLCASLGGCDDAVNALIGETCSPGATICEDGTLKVCLAVKWAEAKQCPAGCAEDGISCKVPEGQECAVDMCADKQTLNRCVDGKIVAEKCPDSTPDCVGIKCVKDTSCTPDDVKCSDDGKGTQICDANGQWKDPAACGDKKVCDPNTKKCVDEGEASVCEDGTMKCADKEAAPNTYYACKDGKWSEEAAKCADDSPICKGDDGKAQCVKDDAPVETKCTPDEVRCSDDGKGTQTCDADGKWKDAVPCGDKKVCDPNSKKCVDEGEAAKCENDTMKCADKNNYYICADGNWSETTTKCADDTPICTGDDGKAKCIAEETPEKCKKDDTKCSDDGKGIQICDDKGNWGDVNPCADAAPVCKVNDAGKAECVKEETPEKCKKGDVRCSDDNTGTQVCDDKGNWGDVKTCPANQVCDPAQNKCTAKAEDTSCQPDTIKCAPELNTVPNSYFTCGTDKKWNTKAPKSCPADKPICTDKNGKAECVAACEEDSVKCTETGAFQVCENGRYVTLAECGDKNSCSAQKPSFGCKCANDHDQNCSEDNKKLLVCERSRYGMTWYNHWTEETCENGCGVDDENTGFCKCAAGTTECDGIETVTCNADGMWDAPKACPDKKICDPATNTCEAACKKGQKRCSDDGSFWICMTDMMPNSPTYWHKVTECGKNMCDDSLGCKCNESGTICNEAKDTVLTCAKMMTQSIPPYEYIGWKQTECENSCAVDKNGAYCTCTNGDAKCSAKNEIMPLGTTLEICTDGHWKEITSNSASTCNANLATYINKGCVTGSRCIGSSVAVCQNGIYVADSTCLNGCRQNAFHKAECITDTGCKNDTVRCSPDNGSVQNCENKKWVDTKCEAGKTCAKNGNKYECVEKVCNEFEFGCTADKSKITMCENNTPGEIASCQEGMECNAGKCVLSAK